MASNTKPIWRKRPIYHFFLSALLIAIVFLILSLSYFIKNIIYFVIAFYFFKIYNISIMILLIICTLILIIISALINKYGSNAFLLPILVAFLIPQLIIIGIAMNPEDILSISIGSFSLFLISLVATYLFITSKIFIIVVDGVSYQRIILEIEKELKNNSISYEKQDHGILYSFIFKKDNSLISIARITETNKNEIKILYDIQKENLNNNMHSFIMEKILDAVWLISRKTISHEPKLPKDQVVTAKYE